ncbi:MAG: leucine-rich repeat domain-containing protein [Microscillaceae bacterium]|nr:leucine-rich repeat domain-containing protein [Microscillaceae bacterium]MDW8461315.1 leucine-rich repeat domain-containing protein [Cytophagales bacterium]
MSWSQGTLLSESELNEQKWFYSLEEALKEPEKVYKLSLTNPNRKLKSLSPEIAKLVNLQKLYLYNNDLTNLPNEITTFRNLQLLDVSNNKLTKLPDNIGNLTNLQVLIATNNQLTLIPESIGNLRNLKVLKLGQNQLSTLPYEIGNLINLQDLDFSSNPKYQRFPQSITKLKNLEVLNMRGTRMTSLPLFFTELTNLRILDLSFNSLTGLPKEISRLRKLEVLSLQVNQLTTLPEELALLQRIVDLNVSKNPLGIVPECITKLTKLQNLDLSFTNLEKLEANMLNLQNLKRLDIKNNPIKSFHPSLYEWLEKLGSGTSVEVNNLVARYREQQNIEQQNTVKLKEDTEKKQLTQQLQNLLIEKSKLEEKAAQATAQQEKALLEIQAEMKEREARNIKIILEKDSLIRQLVQRQEKEHQLMQSLLREQGKMMSYITFISFIALFFAIVSGVLFYQNQKNSRKIKELMAHNQ